MNSTYPALQAQELSKRFGALTALESVSLDLHPGEIHAILGENGAGKSTLLNVLAGFVTPDSGSVRIANAPAKLGDAQAMRRQGVAMVHQHFMLVPNFTVAENLALDSLAGLQAGLHLDTLTAKARTLSANLGWNLDMDRRTGDYPVGVRQRIEILKALCRESPVLFLDEPTAVLSEEETADLFRILRQLRSEGKAIALIAHKLSEIMQIADRVTVLRLGRVVGTGLLADLTQRQIEHWMLGELAPHSIMQPTPSNTIALEVRGLNVRNEQGLLAVRSLDLQVRQGEILGIGGVDGNGQTELAEALAGVRPSAGTVKAEGQIAFIPPDRQRDGLAIEMSVLDNLLIAGHRKTELRSGVFLRPTAVKEWAEALIQKYNIKCESPLAPVRGLSGGNRQKIIVGRTLDQNPQILIAVNPTRGLDFGAAQMVHQCLQVAALAGTAVVLMSSDQDELEAIAHSIQYLHEGTLVDRPLGGAA